jgi:HAD superfamily phosphoserine phosphatase-like hydrolase
MRDGLARPRKAIRIAAFDVDGTLIEGQLGKPLLRAVVEDGLVSRERLAPLLGHVAGLSPEWFEDPVVVAETYRLCGLALRGVSAEALEDVVRRVWAAHRDDLFAFARPLVDDLRDAGFVPMLISGGVDELVGELAADLGIELYRGMRLERAGDVFSGGVRRSAGAAKHEVASALAGRRGIRWSESIAVGDSLPDAALLSRVGHAYAFEPTPALAGRARAGGWTVCGRDTLRPLVRARLGLGIARREAVGSAPVGESWLVGGGTGVAPSPGAGLAV